MRKEYTYYTNNTKLRFHCLSVGTIVIVGSRLLKAQKCMLQRVCIPSPCVFLIQTDTVIIVADYLSIKNFLEFSSFSIQIHFKISSCVKVNERAYLIIIFKHGADR